MDEREVEQGYANFHRKLNKILRSKDVKRFKAHVARHPAQAGKLSRCLSLSDELAEVEMYRAIVIRSALKDMHKDAVTWLQERGMNAPARTRPRAKKGFRKRGKGSR